MEPGAAGRQLGALPSACASRLRARAQASLPGPENAHRPIGRSLSDRLVSDRPRRRLKSRVEGALGHAAAERHSAICRTADFQPWWRPSAACQRNCSFVSGEASEAFWTVAPATLAPPQLRPFALGSAVIFGTAVGSLRVVFGRHFVSDIVFAGLITIAIGFALYRLLLDPIRRDDARLERGIERVSIGLHRGSGPLAGAGRVLASSGSSFAAPANTCTSASPAYSPGGSQTFSMGLRARLFPWRATSRKSCSPIPAGSTPRSS